MTEPLKAGSLPRADAWVHIFSLSQTLHGNCYCLMHIMRRAVPVLGCLLTKPFFFPCCHIFLVSIIRLRAIKYCSVKALWRVYLWSAHRINSNSHCWLWTLQISPLEHLLCVSDMSRSGLEWQVSSLTTVKSEFTSHWPQTPSSALSTPRWS